MADALAVQAHVETIFETLPPYYITSNILRDILTAWVNETDDANLDNDDLILQLYVPTATWGLDYWENDYGITPALEADYATRRANLMAKILGIGTFTKHAAKELANVYSRTKTAEYMSVPLDYSFKTRHDIDDLINYDGLRAAFRENAPAHLQHIIGLIIRLSMNVDEGLAKHIKTAVNTLMFDVANKTKIHMKATLAVAGYSWLDRYTLYQPNNINALYIDGTWYVDGKYKLAGTRDLLALYIRASEELKADIKQNVHLDVNLQYETRPAISKQVTENYLEAYGTYNRINVKAAVAGYTYIRPTDLDVLYLNGGWYLDNSYLLDGVRYDAGYTPNTLEGLYLDGSWTTNGQYNLTGKRVDSLSLFLAAAEALKATVKQAVNTLISYDYSSTITVKQNGSVIAVETI